MFYSYFESGTIHNYQKLLGKYLFYLFIYGIYTLLSQSLFTPPHKGASNTFKRSHNKISNSKNRSTKKRNRKEREHNFMTGWQYLDLNSDVRTATAVTVSTIQFSADLYEKHFCCSFFLKKWLTNDNLENHSRMKS